VLDEGEVEIRTWLRLDTERSIRHHLELIHAEIKNAWSWSERQFVVPISSDISDGDEEVL